MKIHYLCSAVLGSAQPGAVHVIKMCDWFAARGDDVTLSVQSALDTDEATFRYYDLSPRFKIVRHESVSHPSVAPIRYLHRALPFLRLGVFTQLVYGRRVIEPMLKMEQPDLVYTRNIPWLAAARVTVPFIAEIHGVPPNPLVYQLQKRLLGRPECRRLVVISESLRKAYAKLFPWIADRIIVAHDAADDPEPDRWRPPEQNGFHVGYVGGLYPGRVETLLAAARDMPEVNVHLVGGSEADIGRLKAQHLPANVIFHGHQPHAELAGFYGRFDALIAPYQHRIQAGSGRDITQWTSPMKLFEYMSWGKPIICSDLPVLREILQPERNALLVPPADAASLAGAVRRLKSDADLQARLGSQARADFLAKYTWQQRARRVLEGLDLS